MGVVIIHRRISITETVSSPRTSLPSPQYDALYGFMDMALCIYTNVLYVNMLIN